MCTKRARRLPQADGRARAIIAGGTPATGSETFQMLGRIAPAHRALANGAAWAPVASPPRRQGHSLCVFCTRIVRPLPRRSFLGQLRVEHPDLGHVRVRGRDRLERRRVGRRALRIRAESQRQLDFHLNAAAQVMQVDAADLARHG